MSNKTNLPRPAGPARLHAWWTGTAVPCHLRGGPAHYAPLIARGACVRVAAGLACALVTSLGSFSVAGPAGATPPPSTTTTLPPPARAELLVDMETGKVIFAENDHASLPPGSLTKMVTALVAADWLPVQALVPVTPLAANVTPDKVGMKAGQTWPFNDTLQALLVFSANDAAYALAQRVSGSLGQFAATMQEAAAQLGMTDHPVLRDPAGLDGTEGFEGGNRLSAWDIAIAARALMANPQLAAIVGMRRLDFTGPGHVVYGLFNQNLYFLDTYLGAIGIKTGLTDAAGFCVAEEAERGGRRMLAIVMNGSSSYQTAADLLNQGFATSLRAERVNDAVLPPIVEPEPPATVPPERYVDNQLSPGAITADDQGLVAGSHQSLVPSAAIAVGAAAVPIAAGGLVVGLAMRRRKRPAAGAHSQH